MTSKKGFINIEIIRINLFQIVPVNLEPSFILIIISFS